MAILAFLYRKQCASRFPGPAISLGILLRSRAPGPAARSSSVAPRTPASRPSRRSSAGSIARPTSWRVTPAHQVTRVAGRDRLLVQPSPPRRDDQRRHRPLPPRRHRRLHPHQTGQSPFPSRAPALPFQRTGRFSATVPSLRRCSCELVTSGNISDSMQQYSHLFEWPNKSVRIATMRFGSRRCSRRKRTGSSFKITKNGA